MSNKWSRGDVIGFASLIVAIVAIGFAIVTPEVRCLLQLDPSHTCSDSDSEPSSPAKPSSPSEPSPSPPSEPSPPAKPSSPSESELPQQSGFTIDSTKNAECHAQFQGQTLYMFSGAFEPCVRTIRAAAGNAQYGVGTWSNYAIKTDANGRTYVDVGDGHWQYVGVVRNMSGTVGSLQDRCVRGDVQACKQWRNQMDSINSNPPSL